MGFALHAATPAAGAGIPPLRGKARAFTLKVLGGFFHHLADGQVIGAAGFARAAPDAGPGLGLQGGVALAAPLLQAIAVQIPLEQNTLGMEIPTVQGAQ